MNEYMMKRIRHNDSCNRNGGPFGRFPKQTFCKGSVYFATNMYCISHVTSLLYTKMRERMYEQRSVRQSNSLKCINGYYLCNSFHIAEYFHPMSTTIKTEMLVNEYPFQSTATFFLDFSFCFYLLFFFLSCCAAHYVVFTVGYIVTKNKHHQH